jgi:outer membrane autotransporter protein
VTSEVADGQLTYWLRGAGTWGDANGDGIGSGFGSSQWGILTGVDYAKDGFKAGAMFFYTSTDINFDYSALGQSTVETTGGAIYGGYRSDKGWAVAMGGAYAGNNANGTRTVTAPGLAQTLQSDIGGTSYQVFGEIAYDIMAAPEVRAEPFVRLAYTGVDSNDFREIGGVAAIEADSQNVDLTILTLGLRGAYDMGKWRFSGSAGWQYTTGDTSGGVTSTIADLDSLMYIQTVALDENAAVFEAGVSYDITDKIRLGVGYSGLIGPNNSDNGVRGTVSIAF